MNCIPGHSAVVGLDHTGIEDILSQSSYHGVCISLNKSLLHVPISQKDN